LTSALLIAMSPTAAAQTPDLRIDDDDDQPADYKTAFIESFLVLGVSASWYWGHWKENQVDYDLNWDWPSWKRKLNFSAVRFDTNEFSVNAVHHPLQSIIQYHIGRTNHFGMIGAWILSTGYGIFWEYFIEYREYPAPNDMIVNTTSGISIGEPLWQIGQLWRGPDVSTSDRIHTALFSPLDAAHDAWGHGFRRYRPRAWRSISVGVGMTQRYDDDTTHTRGTFVEDIDLVADRHYVTPGSYAGRISPGSWSRFRTRLDLEHDVSNWSARAEVDSRTAIVGHYQQDDDGRGLFVAVGTAFTYRRESAYDLQDHVALAHLVGPQLQLSLRTPGVAVRWDAAGYGDFALIDAFVFSPNPPFVRPPPYISALQAQGYYYGGGLTEATRLRVDSLHWSLDGELEAHQVWQLDGPDRVSAPAMTVQAIERTQLTNAHNISDTRTYGRFQVGYHVGRWGVAAIAEVEHRTSEWTTLRRELTTTELGLLGHVDL
jgi:hypothetical protein